MFDTIIWRCLISFNDYLLKMHDKLKLTDICCIKWLPDNSKSKQISFRVLHLPMQPSMGTLNSPSSRVVKVSTPSRRRILRYTNFGNGESSPILFLDMMNLHLIIFGAWWILNERAFYYFIFFSLFYSKSWPRKYKSAWWIFTQLYFWGGESWPNYFGKEVNWWWILT